MGAVSIESEDKVIDDISEKADLNKLAVLKAKSKEKQVSSTIIAKKERSYSLGFIGSGQAGTNLCAVAHSLGYQSIAINTAIQDLKFANIPDSNKLLLEYGPGGAAKELEIGKAAAEQYRGQILDLINDKLSKSDINVFCTSLGGGSGAGSCEVIIDILTQVGKPIVVITVLPMDTEDPQTKSNALETLSKLSTFAQTKKINNLIIVDNAKLESIYQNVGQMDFYEVANKAIIEPLDVFNALSSMPSSVKGLDPLEFSKILIDGEGLSTYGELIVQDYTEDTAIAEAVINNLNSNLLASGFDLKQSKYVGIIIAANEKVWEKIPSSSITYALAMINEQCGNPKGVFKGIYTINATDPVVKVYSIFSGLGLPDSRVSQLKKEVQEHNQVAKNKDVQRNLNLKLETGMNETVSAAQKIKDKIAAKSSAFGKLVGGIVDRRKG